MFKFASVYVFVYETVIDCRANETDERDFNLLSACYGMRAKTIEYGSWNIHIVYHQSLKDEDVNQALMRFLTTEHNRAGVGQESELTAQDGPDLQQGSLF